MPTENKPAESGLNFNTPDAGRAYIADLFKTVLKRHDYRQYIYERLAGDFACTLAEHFEAIKAREAVLQADLDARDQRVDELEQALAAVTEKAHDLTVKIHAEFGNTEHDSECKEDVAALYAMAGITQSHTCRSSCPAGRIGAKP
ncbi:hypothetical protein [Pseudomonas chlororaphis]|uniref:hypothetical protein n=1 Tax=Pseudomonas chlororaphis TaxID=587753 RepID=UPI002368DE07|nr:hypothetical protein [Pseudomonas chlororaphis]WDG45713.1 hypothetical protein PUP58_18285 [Pseudomonas chlororaphis]